MSWEKQLKVELIKLTCNKNTGLELSQRLYGIKKNEFCGHKKIPDLLRDKMKKNL